MLKISSYVFAVWLTFFYVWKCQTFSSYVFDVWLTFCQLQFVTFTQSVSCGNVKNCILRFRRMAYVFLCAEVSNFFILPLCRIAYVLSVSVLEFHRNLPVLGMSTALSYLFAVWLTFLKKSSMAYKTSVFLRNVSMTQSKRKMQKKRKLYRRKTKTAVWLLKRNFKFLVRLIMLYQWDVR